MSGKERINLEDFLITLSERLLSDVKRIRIGRMNYEPYVDVSEKEDFVLLTAELSGVKGDDVRVAAGGNGLELILVKNGCEVFREVYGTPGLNPRNVSIKFKNSILEIKAEKIR